MADLRRGMTTSSVKIIWGELEIIGNPDTALFPVTADTSIDIPNSNLYENEISGDSWGHRAIRRISDESRDFLVQIGSSFREGAMAIMIDGFNDGKSSPMKVISLLPESIGDVLVQYDVAMLKQRPRITNISNDFPVMELLFTVGFDLSTVG